MITRHLRPVCRDIVFPDLEEEFKEFLRTGQSRQREEIQSSRERQWLDIMREYQRQDSELRQHEEWLQLAKELGITREEHAMQDFVYQINKKKRFGPAKTRDYYKTLQNIQQKHNLPDLVKPLKAWYKSQKITPKHKHFMEKIRELIQSDPNYLKKVEQIIFEAYDKLLGIGGKLDKFYPILEEILIKYKVPRHEELIKEYKKTAVVMSKTTKSLLSLFRALLLKHLEEEEGEDEEDLLLRLADQEDRMEDEDEDEEDLLLRLADQEERTEEDEEDEDEEDHLLRLADQEERTGDEEDEDEEDEI